MKITKIACALALLLTSAVGHAEEEVQLTFGSYLQQVARGNLDLIAQKSNVSIAQASIGIAKVFPDPTVTAGLLQYDITNQGNPTATYAQLNWPVQIGGQRGARIDVAEAGVARANADLDDFWRMLRASAGDAYVNALYARLTLDRKRRTLSSLERLVSVNEQRLRVGDVGETVMVQSRVEAQQFRAQVWAGEGEVKAADLALIQLLGSAAKPFMNKALVLAGDLHQAADRTFVASAVVAEALAHRPDLRSAQKRQLLAQKQVALARANRVIDVTFGAYWQHNFFASTAAGPSPTSDFLGGTVTVPIPFSRMYRGELDQARATEDQSRALTQAAMVVVEVEVRQAIARYDAAASRVKLYTRGVLSDADSVLDKTLYNYQHGGATLVEVLVAQRMVNDVYLSYYDALADAAHALVAVSQASAKWDLPL